MRIASKLSSIIPFQHTPKLNVMIGVRRIKHPSGRNILNSLVMFIILIPEWPWNTTTCICDAPQLIVLGGKSCGGPSCIIIIDNAIHIIEKINIIENISVNHNSSQINNPKDESTGIDSTIIAGMPLRNRFSAQLNGFLARVLTS
jgi:hypothetical protein